MVARDREAELHQLKLFIQKFVRANAITVLRAIVISILYSPK
jgi:hypothetical protein